MITHWIYDNPTWLWGSVLVIGTMALACLGLVLFHGVVDTGVRRSHNDLTGFVLAVIGVVYAVLLAFIAIATWESFSATESTVRNEAGYVDMLYRDTRGFPPAVGTVLRKELKDYVDTVVHQEWPVQMRGKVPTAGLSVLEKVQNTLVTYQPATRGDAVVQAEFLHNLNRLYTTREARVLDAKAHVPDVIWWIVIIGGAATTAYTYLFGFADFRMHLTITASLAGSLALVIILIVALDWPLRGEVAVSPDAYLRVERGWQTGVSSHAHGPGDDFAKAVGGASGGIAPRFVGAPPSG